MTYLSDYRNRVSLSSSDRLINSSKQNLIDKFNKHPYYQTVLINDIQFDAIVTQSSKSQDKKMLLKPDIDIDIGSVVKIGTNVYLVSDFLSNGINDLYPVATLTQCNYTLQLKGDEIRRTLVGNNRFNEPQYEIVYNTLFIPCIIKSTTDSFNSTDLDQPINLPNGKLRIIITYNEANKIVKENDEFTIYNRKYKVVGLDFSGVFNEKGIITLNMERVVKD